MNNTLDVVFCNVKGGTAASGLGAGNRRLGLGHAATRVAELVQRTEADVYGLVECNSLQMNKMTEMGYMARRGGWNEVHGPVGLGNVFFFKPNFETPSRSPITYKSGKYDLNFPVVHATKLNTIFILVHWPAGKTASAKHHKRQCKKLVRKRIRELRKQFKGIRFVIMGDSNETLFLKSWRGIRHRVDFIKISRLKYSKRSLLTWVHGVITDHNAGLKLRIHF